MTNVKNIAWRLWLNICRILLFVNKPLSPEHRSGSVQRTLTARPVMRGVLTVTCQCLGRMPWYPMNQQLLIETTSVKTIKPFKTDYVWSVDCRFSYEAGSRHRKLPKMRGTRQQLHNLWSSTNTGCTFISNCWSSLICAKIQTHYLYTLLNNLWNWFANNNIFYLYYITISLYLIAYILHCIRLYSIRYR